MQYNGNLAKKKIKNFSHYFFLTNQMESCKFLLNTGTKCIIKYFLIIAILLC